MISIELSEFVLSHDRASKVMKYFPFYWSSIPFVIKRLFISEDLALINWETDLYFVEYIVDIIFFSEDFSLFLIILAELLMHSLFFYVDQY